MNDPELLRNTQASDGHPQEDARGNHTLSEILTQPAAWRAALEVIKDKQAALRKLWEDEPFSDILVIGCGSTYYLSLAVAPLLQQMLGKRARALPASELLLFPETVLPPASNVLLVVISRSGGTSETILAVEAFKRHQRGKVLYIGCYADSTLAKLSDLALTVREGQEESVAQTRSFSTMLVTAHAATALLANKGEAGVLASLPELGEQLLASYHDLARQLGRQPRFERFYFLGSGSRYGLACEANLKMKEMSLSISEAFHFMEFRHGPMSMVNEHTLIVGLLSDSARAYEMAVLREMRALGGRTLVLSERAVTEQEADHQVTFNSGLPEAYHTVLNLPILQLFGYHRAILNGQNPDRPHNLSAVVVLEAGQSS